MRKHWNSKGLTLVEVLAVLVLGTIIALLAFNVLSSMFFNQKEKITTSANVRDVADYYLESLTSYIYSLNESNVEDFVQSPTKGYYIVEKDSKDKITGFKKEGATIFLYIGGEKIESPYSEITIADFPQKIEDQQITKIEKAKQHIYKITLTLKYNNNQSMTFTKEIHSIP